MSNGQKRQIAQIYAVLDRISNQREISAALCIPRQNKMAPAGGDPLNQTAFILGLAAFVSGQDGAW